ncbi:MAG: S53 family peptidase [Thermoprotei archaeon]
MRIKDAVAVILVFLTLAAFVPYGVLASPALAVQYYAEPMFKMGGGQAQAGSVLLGFPYPEGTPPYDPSQVAAYYGFDQLWQKSYEGQGETIVIVDAFGSPTIYQDTAVFDAVFGLPPISLQVVALPGPSNSTLQDREGWAMETSLDVEWAHAMAPYAKIVLVEASSDSLSAMYKAVAYAVQNRLGQVISMSWGLPEPYELEVTGPGSIQSFHAIFAKAISEGITLVASSGDQGAYNGLQTPNVNYPASDPYVLAVGGTNLTLSSSTYGTTAYGDVSISSTKEYLWSYSGGGESSYFAEPSWQASAGIELTTQSGAVQPTGRAVPDVAYAAMSPYGASGWAGLWIFDSTPYVFQVQSSSGQVSTYVIVGWYGVGGTSCGSPAWSALIADSLSSRGDPSLGPQEVHPKGQQLAAAPGLAVGFGLVTPSIYAEHESYSSYFNPVIPYETSYLELNNNGYYYYSTGWDAITGWGSPRASALLEVLGS